MSSPPEKNSHDLKRRAAAIEQGEECSKSARAAVAAANYAPKRSSPAAAQVGNDGSEQNLALLAEMEALRAQLAEKENKIKASEAAAAEEKRKRTAAEAAAAEAERERKAAEKKLAELDKERQETMQMLKEAQQKVYESSDMVENCSLESLVKNGLPDLEPRALAFVSSSRHRCAQVQEKNHRVDLASFHPPVRNRENKHVGSAFLALVKEKVKLPYGCENDIQFFLRALLMDAASCLDIAAEIFGELSLFSMRPDLVVVRLKQTGSIILVVEVKNPPLDIDSTSKKNKTSKKNEFASSTALAGQVYDYLKAMVQSGHELPFVVLSNYKEMYIARLPFRDDDYEKLMDEAHGYLVSDIGKFSEVMEAGFQGSKDSASPSKDFAARSGGLRTANDRSTETPHAGQETGGSRGAGNTANRRSAFKLPFAVLSKLRPRKDRPQNHIVRSRVYKRNDSDFFKAFVYAIACGVLSCRDIDRSKHFLPLEDESAVTRGELAKVSQTDFQWGALHAKFRYCPETPKGPPPFYLIQVLGIGSSGKVFLAATEAGNLFALKLFLPKLKFVEDVAERQEEWRSSKQLAKIEAEIECHRWKLLYKIKCEVVEVNNTWSLKMPFIQPLPAAKRVEVLENVRQQFMNFASKGLVYAEDDVRWRHVGCRDPDANNLDIVLMDLGSLVRVDDLDDKVEIRGKVNQQIESLRTRMGEADAADSSHRVQLFASPGVPD